jgi:hypothetical protein
LKILRADNKSSLDAVFDFAEKHKLVFCRKSWADNYPSDNLYICAIFNNNSELIGCFSIYIFKKLFFKILITPPFAPHIGLFYVNPAESVVGRHSFEKEIHAAVADYLGGLKCNHTDINLPYEIRDTQSFIWKGYQSRTRFSYIIDLHKTEAELWDNLSSEKRKSINKAKKDNVEIRETGDYELVYELVLKSLRRNDKAANVELIHRIISQYPLKGDCMAFIAYHSGKPIAATFCIHDGTRAIYLFGGIDENNKHHGAAVSCMWQSILMSKNKGLKYFDFEGSMNVTIEKYFREFGGQIVPYFSLNKTSSILGILMNLKGHKSF